MAQADGSVKIDVGLETKDAQKQYAGLIGSLTKKANKLKAEIDRLSKEAIKFEEAGIENADYYDAVQRNLIEKYSQINAELAVSKMEYSEINSEIEKARRGLERLKENSNENVSSTSKMKTSYQAVAYDTERINSAIEEYASGNKKAVLQTDFLKSNTEQIKSDVDRINASEQSVIDSLKTEKQINENISNTKEKINTHTNKFSKSLKNVEANTKKIQINTKGISNSLSGGIRKILRYGMALISIRSIYGMLSNSANAWLSGSSKGAKQLKADIDYMKYAIGYALSPAIKVIVNLLSQALSAVGALVKVFTGLDIFAGSYSDYMSSALSSASGTTKELKKQLAGFDKINKMQDQSSSGGGGGGGGAGTPSFNLADSMNKYLDWANKIKDVVGQIKTWLWSIAGALVGWKLADWLGLSTRQKFGLAITLGSIPFYVEGIKGLANGELTPENFMKVFASSAGLGVGMGMLTGNWKLGLIVTLGALAVAGGISIGEAIKQYVPDSIDWYIKVVNLDWDHDSVADKVWKTIIIILGTIGDAIVKWVGEFATRLLKHEKEYFSNSLTILGSYIKLWLLDILEKVASYIEKLPGVGKALATGIRAGINSERENTKKELEDAIEYAKTHSANPIKNAGMQIGRNILGEGIEEGIENKETDLTKTTENTMRNSSLRAEWSARDGGRHLGDKVIEGARSGVSDGQNNLQSTTENTVNDASRRVNVKDTAKSIGSNVMSGILAGITGNTAGLVASMGTVATKLMSKFKTTLGIHSPSREMMNLAKFIPLGIAEGIDATSDKAVGSMQNLVEDIKDTAEGMSDIDYSQIAKVSEGAIKYIPRQSISTNAVQSSIVGSDMSSLLNNLENLTTGSKQKIEITLNLDGQELLKQILNLNDGYNLATNGGGF